MDVDAYPLTMKVTDYTRSSLLYPTSMDGPDGRVMKIAVWDQAADKVRNLKLGSFYQLKNVSVRPDREGYLEGHIRISDKDYDTMPVKALLRGNKLVQELLR